MLNLANINIYVALAVNGIFTGLGVAIGTYFAQNHVIGRLQKLEGILNKKEKKKDE
ncbi:MAG: hypothetical protein WC711_04085 [Candidatus Staskawiczbacteria bacterium]|jgi:hypothetical protein